MFGLIKIAGLSAVLSAGLVTGFAPEPAAGGKLYQDRVAQSFEDAAPAVRPVAFTLAAAETTGSIQKAAQHCTAQVAEHRARVPERRLRHPGPCERADHHDREARDAQHLDAGAPARRRPAPLSIVLSRSAHAAALPRSGRQS